MPRKKKSKTFARSRLLTIVLLIFAAFVLPKPLMNKVFLEWGPYDLNTHYRVFSYDNFYDEEEGHFLGEERSITRFEYAIEEMDGDIAIVKNSFDVRTSSGLPIVNIERQYGVDVKTGMHAPGYGDKDRDGYLFAPRMKGPFPQQEEHSDYLYWHINYDEPARMTFVREEEIRGILTYHYRSDYEGKRIDQTSELIHLSGVPEERGVGLYPELDVWIDPYTGLLLKYEDDTEAYFYDIETGEDLVPWNHFENVIDVEGVGFQIRQIQAKRLTAIIWMIFMPGSLLSIAFFLLFVKGLYRP